MKRDNVLASMWMSEDLSNLCRQDRQQKMESCQKPMILESTYRRHKNNRTHLGEAKILFSSLETLDRNSRTIISTVVFHHNNFS